MAIVWTSEFLSVTITIALDTHLSAHAKVEAVKESADKVRHDPPRHASV